MFAILIGLLTAGFAFAKPPNVILIMSDDQGYGDLGVHGNPIVRTPNLDAMAKRSARWEYFYVSPVCTPTRACLMTGRYNYRTRAIDTYRGRAMMDRDELTLAELLRPAGYATGIFGKWHLGDCYPLRAVDQGFDMALVHRGGGIGQPSDPPGAEGKYTDPVLFRNGEAEPQHGYCTDVYFTEGMKWAGEQHQQQKPFFLYLPTNCPHGPYDDVPADKLAYYRQQDISANRFPKSPGNAVPQKLNVDQLSRVYAMIENIDDNIGRLFHWLDDNKLAEDTLVIFITDNGPATVGWNAGLKGRKADVFDGGIRSPAFFHWPGHFPAGLRQGRIAAHIDIVPTILELCEVPIPKPGLSSGKPGFQAGKEARLEDKPGFALDGRSLLSALKTGDADWPERSLFFQSHRGDVPFPRHNCAVRTERWKLVHPSGFGKESFDGEPKWQLYDMAADPFEQHDLAAQHPEILQELQTQYDDWFADVSATRPDNYAPPRIIVGSPEESLTVLTRQDWRGANWGPKDQGHWLIDVAHPGAYHIRLQFRSPPVDGTTMLQIGDRKISSNIKAGVAETMFPSVELPAGPQQITAWIEAAEETAGVMFIELSRK